MGAPPVRAGRLTTPPTWLQSSRRRIESSANDLHPLADVGAVLVHDAGQRLEEQEVAGGAGVDDACALERRQLGGGGPQRLGRGVEGVLGHGSQPAVDRSGAGRGRGPGDGEDGALGGAGDAGVGALAGPLEPVGDDRGVGLRPAPLSAIASAKPRTSWLRMTPELPRAVSSSDRASAEHSCARVAAPRMPAFSCSVRTESRAASRLR